MSERKPTDITKAIEEIRAAGGSDWDEIRDVEEFLGRKPTDAEAEVERLKDERDDALAEVERLRTAIARHRDQRGDDRCWLDDSELYYAIGHDLAETALPPKCEFLESCSRFWEQRQHPADRGRADGKTIAQLEAEVARLTTERDKVIAYGLSQLGEDEYDVSLAGHTIATGVSRAEAIRLVREEVGLDGAKETPADA